MTRTESLEKRFPHFALSFIDLFKNIDKTRDDIEKNNKFHLDFF